MQEGELYIERRRHKRIEKRFRVNYKVIMAEEEVREIRKNVIKQEGESADISMGGIGVEGEMPGVEGDIIRLEVIVEGGREPITTFAEVKWIKDIGGNRKSFGLEFLILKDLDKKIVEEIIGE